MSVTVTPTNDGPVAVGDAATTAEDTAVSIAVLANDSDLDGDTLTVSAATTPAHGTATVNPDGTITYTPAANYHGADSFGYTAGDGNGGTATATVSVTVTGVNDGPVAVNDAATTAEDTAVSVAVLANDSDLDGDALTVSAVTLPAHGTTVINPDGTITYTPAANYHGTDSFGYTIGDGNGGTATAVVTMVLTAANDAPMAVGDVATVLEDATAVIVVLANDSDAEADSLSVTGVSAPAHGVAAINGDGSITYTPAADYSGADSFVYVIGDGNGGIAAATVSVTITAVPDGPVGFNDLAATPEDTPVIIAVLANDTDADGDGLSVSAIQDLMHGTAVVNADGTITYAPAANFNGTGGFTYTLSDGHGGTATSSVSVTITPVNDGPAAEDDTATTVEDTAVSVPVLANDSDPDGDSLSVSAVSAPQHGTVSINPDGTITYIPEADYHGADSFTYTIQTGAVTLEWDPSPDVDVAGYRIYYGTQPGIYTSTIDFGSALGGAVHGLVKGQQYYFTATAYGAAGVESILSPEVSHSVMTGPDSGPETSATATVHVTVAGANDAPVAADDAATTAEDTAVVVAVLTNDTDLDGDTLAVTGASTPAHGTAAVNADGTITYAPATNYQGADSFSYTIGDGAAAPRRRRSL